MRHTKLILLFVIVIVASGCADEDSGKGIVVDRLDIEPAEITEGNSFSTVMEVRNSGLLEGKVDVGNEDGDEVFTNHCSDYFNIEEFEARTERGSDTDKENIYSLADGERLEMQWKLQQEGGNIPQFGYTCNLKFEIPFNYSVTAYKQLQILEDRNVETEAELNEESSTGPMAFDMELIGTSLSRSNSFLKSENVSLYITAYNQLEEKESPYLGFIEMQDILLDTRGPIRIPDDSCINEDNVVLASGENNIYRCDIEVDEEEYSDPSSRGEVTAKVNYTYVRDLNERSIQVSPRGR